MRNPKRKSEVEKVCRRENISRATYYRRRKGLLPIRRKNAVTDPSGYNQIILDLAVKNPILSGAGIHNKLSPECTLSRTGVWKKMKEMDLNTKEDRLIAAYTLQLLSRQDVIKLWKKHRLGHTPAFPDEIYTSDIKRSFLPEEKKSKIRYKKPILFPGAVSYVSIRELEYSILKLQSPRKNVDDLSVIELIYFDEYSHFLTGRFYSRADGHTIDSATKKFLADCCWSLIKNRKSLFLLFTDFTFRFPQTDFDIFKDTQFNKPELGINCGKTNRFLHNKLFPFTGFMFDCQDTKSAGLYDRLAFHLKKGAAVNSGSGFPEVLDRLYDCFYKRTLRMSFNSLQQWQDRLDQYIDESNNGTVWGKYCYGRSPAETFKSVIIKPS